MITSREEEQKYRVGPRLLQDLILISIWNIDDNTLSL